VVVRTSKQKADIIKKFLMGIVLILFIIMGCVAIFIFIRHWFTIVQILYCHA
jgi:hypothetical protein